MRIAGIDLSITCPGVTTFEGGKKWKADRCGLYYYHKSIDGFYSYTCGVGLINTYGTLHKPWLTQMERFQHILDWFNEILDTDEPSVVALEGYSFMSKGRQHDKAELTGLVKMELHRRAIQVIDVSPAKLKKYATGKGNAKKDEMNDAFTAECGIDLKANFNPAKSVDSPSGDMIDSYYLCRMVHDHMTGGRVTLK